MPHEALDATPSKGCGCAVRTMTTSVGMLWRTALPQPVEKVWHPPLDAVDVECRDLHALPDNAGCAFGSRVVTILRCAAERRPLRNRACAVAFRRTRTVGRAVQVRKPAGPVAGSPVQHPNDQRARSPRRCIRARAPEWGLRARIVGAVGEFPDAKVNQRAPALEV